MTYQTPTLVQGPAQGYAGGAGSGSFNINLSQTPTNGNVLILCYIANATTNPASVSSISQTGVSWTSAFTFGYTEDCEIWIGIVSSGAGTTITVNYSGGSGGSYGEIADVCEWSGVVTGSYLDQTAANNGGHSATLDTGTTSTTTQTVELWIGVVGGESNSSISGDLSSPTNGFTLLDGVPVNVATSVYMVEGYLYEIVSTTGKADSGATSPSSIYWSGCIATFKAASSATQPVTFVQHWLWAVKQILHRIPRFRGHIDMTKNLKRTGKIWQILRSLNL